jgi:hypothetical protein
VIYLIGGLKKMKDFSEILFGPLEFPADPFIKPEKYPHNWAGHLLFLGGDKVMVTCSREYNIGTRLNPVPMIAYRGVIIEGEQIGAEFDAGFGDKGENISSPTYIRNEDGSVTVYYYASIHEDRDNEFGRCLIKRRDSNDCKKWSKPIIINPAEDEQIVGDIQGRVIGLRSGRVVIPTYIGGRKEDGKTLDASTVFLSDDRGKTFRKIKQNLVILDKIPSEIFGEEDLVDYASEPSVVEKKDGALFMLLRTCKGRAYYSESNDEGETWSEPKPTELRASWASVTVVRIPTTDDLLAIYNNTIDPIAEGNRMARYPLTAAISKDGGKTWGNYRNLETKSTRQYQHVSIDFKGDEAHLVYMERTVDMYPDTNTSPRSWTRYRRMQIGWFYG